MLIIKNMNWSWLFSYGPDNYIDFSSTPLTQILGQNGHGKSSIALILEEALYNKNSKGIKKADILNRNSSSKSYSIEVNLEKDGVSYNIKVHRASVQTVKLLRDNEDISSHTATATYKEIESIIGYDHKTFAQIVYQSSASSLEFLTATDGNRKKFLIDLLNLNKYVEAGETFKLLSKTVSDELVAVNARIAAASIWLKTNTLADMNILPILDVPESPRVLVEKVSTLKVSIDNIDTKNKVIIKNNTYKERLDSITIEPIGNIPDTDTKNLVVRKTELNKDIKDADAFILKMKQLKSQCPTCLEPINEAKVRQLISDSTLAKKLATEEVTKLTEQINSLIALEAQWKIKVANNTSYEEYHSLYDPFVPKELLNKDDLVTKIAEAEAAILEANNLIKKINSSNATALAHNAKIDIIKSQTEDIKAQLNILNSELSDISRRYSNLQVLVKTFGPTGLVAYKIECLVKDLEDTSNEYLNELSSGRFQLSFQISGADKLNVIITDNGKDIEMLALSGGERARVNTAALLGIRKLMQSLSNTRINLMILDETIENLDLEGKEKLVEVLLSEDLNTFIISHGFSHPLLEKLSIVKTNNISRIE